MMASENFPAAFRVVRKLEMMIDKIVKLVQRDSTRAVWERAEESYGVYFKAGNKDFLWFGLWNFGRARKPLLCRITQMGCCRTRGLSQPLSC
jgi:hypothetical protein